MIIVHKYKLFILINILSRLESRGNKIIQAKKFSYFTFTLQT